MPREPANPFGFTWSPTAIMVLTAEHLPGVGVWWVFDRWDPSWWPVAANDP